MNTSIILTAAALAVGILIGARSPETFRAVATRIRSGAVFAFRWLKARFARQSL